MLTYWLMYGVAALAALPETAKPAGRRAGPAITFILPFVALVALIGFRKDVGGDWGNYVRNLSIVSGHSLEQVLSWGDPGYQLISWIALTQGWGITGVNVICAVIFSFGLLRFCYDQPRPWLALLVAVPYLIIVVAMGYTRQGVAIGAAMLALVALARQSSLWFVMWVALAATFHKSAVILIPIAVIAAARRKLWTALWVGLAATVMFSLLLADSYEALYINYIQAQYQSEGAAIRVAMNAVPALLFIYFRKRLPLSEPEQKLWTWMSVIAVGFVPLLIVSPSSTAVDRIALYFTPLQVLVFSRLPAMADLDVASSRFMTFGIAAYYGLVQFVWLFYAVHASGWIPYDSYLF